MIGLAEITLSDEVRQVPHRWNEPVGKGRHVADTGASGCIGHQSGVGNAQRERLFTQDMLAMLEGGQSHGKVGVVGCGDDDRMDIVARYDVGKVCGNNRCTSLLSGILQGA